MQEIPRMTRHFEPEKGWMNDPNGLCWYKGQYHAFYQYYPHQPKWGPMHWGHATSTDLVHWQEQPIALHPDMPYENDGGCFSGSALEKDGDLYLLYTSVSKEQGQTQSLAISHDGAAFEKYPGNPVIGRSPLDPASKDFRDPKMFAYGDGYRMVCGAGINGLGSVLLFKSQDLVNWEYIGPIFQSRDYGPVPECPDLFPLEDKWVLMFSRMDESRSAQFIVGDFNGERFIPSTFQQPEQGTDFYAPQTFLDGRGRRVMIGWLFNWNRQVPEGAVRAGALSIPRELKLVNGKLHNYPVAEAQALLAPDDPCVRRENGQLAVNNGARDLLTVEESAVAHTAILRDTRTCEVFLNHGAISCTFYTEG